MSVIGEGVKVASLGEWKARHKIERVSTRKRVCPACKREAVFRPSRSRGFVERAIFPLLGRRLFRCSECGTRLSLAEQTGSIVSDPPSRTEFLPSQDEKGFREVIGEMQLAERALSNPPRRLAVIGANQRPKNSGPSGGGFHPLGD